MAAMVSIQDARIKAHFEYLFPNLIDSGWLVTSPQTRRYNCVAWAALDEENNWWPRASPAFFWPESVERVETIDSFVAAFVTLGYSPEVSDRDPSKVDRVAIFTDSGAPKHVARQTSDGLWTSKIGQSFDIAHTLEALESGEYGDVAMILEREKVSPR